MRFPFAIIVIWVSAVACAAAVTLVPPTSEWADCEASTNAVLPATTWQRRGHFDVRLSVARGTNLVQVAFGRDADCDGVLSYDEITLVVGRGPGEVFFEDVAARRRYAEQVPPSGTGRLGLDLRISLNGQGSPVGFAAKSEAGASVFPGWRHAPPACCFDLSWNMMRVVSAGPDGADGRARVEIGPDGTLLILR